VLDNEPPPWGGSDLTDWDREVVTIVPDDSMQVEDDDIPGGSSNLDDFTNPKTSDQANPTFWFILMIISAITLRWVLMNKRKLAVL
jgi:hypothetical protein